MQKMEGVIDCLYWPLRGFCVSHGQCGLHTSISKSMRCYKPDESTLWQLCSQTRLIYFLELGKRKRSKKQNCNLSRMVAPWRNISRYELFFLLPSHIRIHMSWCFNSGRADCSKTVKSSVPISPWRIHDGILMSDLNWGTWASTLNSIS